MCPVAYAAFFKGGDLQLGAGSDVLGGGGGGEVFSQSRLLLHEGYDETRFVIG